MIRVAVLYVASPGRQPKLKLLSEALADGLRTQGAQVDVINGAQARDLKLTGYHYLAVGCDVRSLFKGNLPPELGPLLSNGGIITGKRAFAFVGAGWLGSDSTLIKLMKALEHEGIHLRYSEKLVKSEEAEALGKRLKLD